MFPHQLEKLERDGALPTQLYVSLDGPNEEVFLKIDQPVKSLKEPWKQLMRTMELIKGFRKNHNTRTCIRVTCVKGYNMVLPEQWAGIIKNANPTFLEVKGYSWVGSSRERLLLENSPRHNEVKAFAEEIGKHCGYKYIDEQERSRVVLLMQEDIPGRIMTWDD